jgi:hypothetical protein
MRWIWMTVAIMFLTLASCQSDATLPPIIETHVAATDIPPTSSEPSTSPTPAESSTMEASVSTPSSALTGMPPNETVDKIVTLVTQHLAQQQAISVEQIVLVEAQPMVWRDASLGCPRPNVDYMPVETPGFRIVLEAGGETYVYHTDETRRFVQCNR